MERQLIILICITIIAGISMAMVSVSHDPFNTTESIKLLFFGAMFSFFWSAGTLAFFILNIGTRDRWADSFRRGLFLAMLFLLLIFFRRHDIFSWYIGAVLGGIFIAMEVWIYKILSNKNNVDGWSQ